MTLPDLVAANLFVASFVGPIKCLNGFVEQFATGMAGFNRFIELKNTETEPADAPIGIVQQDVFLFAGTIRENIAYGKPNATQEESELAARRAEIHEHILKMPNGYDSVVGERGIKLSGGQKQRVSIVIAHRLSTIKNADKIAVVNDHGIVELGTHEELMAKHGEYYKLQSAQVTVQ